MELELQGYKSKVEQMAVVIRHYQNELESHKARRDGVETVSRLLAESRQENIMLKKNLVTMETRVKNLQNRMAVNGISSGTENDENEVIVPGTSKQTLTNLAMENKRLRSMLQKDNGSESIGENNSLHKQTEDTETGHTHQQLIDKLKSENKSMKMKLSDLEMLFKSSNNDKDRQLVQLLDEVRQLKEKPRQKMESVNMDSGLPALKEQLRAFMSQCQDFQLQLDKVPGNAGREENGVELTPVLKQAVERADSVDGADVKQLMEEKQKLQDRVEEVTKMNQRWQDFFNERDRYTQSLEQKVQETEERLKEAMRSGPSQEINRRIQQVLEKSKKEVEQAEEMKRKAEDEVQQLRQEMALRDAHITQLQNEVTILSRSPNQQSTIEANSTIEHLKAQIQVCTEDFEKERQDRQVALQKVASLQKQLASLQKLNTQLSTLASSQTGQGSRPAAQEHGHHEHNPHTLQPRGAHYPFPGLDYDSPRGPQTIGNDWRDFPNLGQELSSRDQVPTGPVSVPGTATELIARGPRPQHSLSEPAAESPVSKQNILTCPKCNKEFSEEHQRELLAHMDVCWE